MYPKIYYPILLLSFSLSLLSAQRTISGHIFFADGEEQIGGYVSNYPDFRANVIIPIFDGYTIEVPDSTEFLYINWDGTINPRVPIHDREVVNVINAYPGFGTRIDYPKTPETGSSSTVVYGQITENGKPLVDEVSVTPMVSRRRELPSVPADEQGRFTLEMPREARVLRVQHQWRVQHFVIPDVESVYLPIKMSEEFLLPRMVKRLQRKADKRAKKEN